MPPKRKSKKPPPKEIVRIDPNKHAAALKEIEESHKQYQLDEEQAALAAAEELLDEEEMGSEEEEYSEESEEEPSILIGGIILSFPETTSEFENSPQCYPPSYYTLSPKERILLCFAENFRRQFVFNNPKRRPLVLALPNECNVQKFVCSTIRPTVIPFVSLISNVEGCASFVADFIIYEQLEDVMRFPTRLVSPATLLRYRRGNCFEMATLLCSLLIGAGFPAMVVSGVARHETVVNDQRNVPYPHKMVEPKEEEEEIEEKKVKSTHKYKLREMPDLVSHLEENMAEMLRQKEEEERKQREEQEQLEQQELDLRAVDRYHYRRTHAWVVIIDNAPWSIQPRKTHTVREGSFMESPPSARFIEPTTGFIYGAHNVKQYILIDSVWNQYNYYVNIQKYQRISELRWDLRVTADWEHFLPGEPPEMRTYTVYSDENLNQNQYSDLEEKHLDMLRSWVSKLVISPHKFEERFPRREKTIHYKQAIHERFSPYSQRDGKVMQVTFYSDNEYKEPTSRWEYYEHRSDLLQLIKYSYEESRIEEYFAKCRDDSLKYMDYNSDPSKPKYFYFYSKPRLDALRYMEVYNDRIILFYDNRSDYCYYRYFEYKSSGNVLKKIVEKFRRNASGPANRDIAIRTFLIPQRQIQLKFHYAHGALTSSFTEFTKPPKPDYGQEIIFDPNLTKSYKANVADPDIPPLELYRLLLKQLQAEDKIKKEFEKIIEEVNTLFDQRRQEMRNPKLKFLIFDSLRNGATRSIRLKQYNDEEEFKKKMSTLPADYLAPYLVPYKNRVLTVEESWAAYNACLQDLRTYCVELLNDLQHQYEDLSSEGISLKRFLDKFEGQFNNYDYKQLLDQARVLELNKRMVQQRLVYTHERSQEKYNDLEESLKIDTRLNLKRKKSK